MSWLIIIQRQNNSLHKYLWLIQANGTCVRFLTLLEGAGLIKKTTFKQEHFKKYENKNPLNKILCKITI